MMGLTQIGFRFVSDMNCRYCRQCDDGQRGTMSLIKISNCFDFYRRGPYFFRQEIKKPSVAGPVTEPPNPLIRASEGVVTSNIPNAPLFRILLHNNSETLAK